MSSKNSRFMGVDQGATRGAQQAAGVFIVARPAQVGRDHRNQRYFGPGIHAAHRGVPDAAGGGGCRVSVFRFEGEATQLTIHLGLGAGDRGHVIAELDAPGLREVAQRLIDAAVDMEAEAELAQRLTDAAAIAKAEGARP